MSDWKTEFKKAFIDEIVQSGSPVRTSGTGFWGWRALDWQELRSRVASVGIDYENSTHDESRWWDGADTFNEGSERIGIDADIRLKDGSVVRFRYDGTASDLIMALVK